MADFPVRIPQQLRPLLQGFRKTAGLTQADVAARMGITQQTLSALERNASQVSVSRLLKLLGVLGVELVLRSQPAAHPEGPDMPVRPAKPGKAAW
jgi:HTH-type transcriptional regulator/antitoxin HipB